MVASKKRNVHWHQDTECPTFATNDVARNISKYNVSGDSDVGDIVMLAIFQRIKSVNLTNLSPTHLVSNIRHRHQCSQERRIADTVSG